MCMCLVSHSPHWILVDLQVHWIHLPESWKAGSNSCGRRLFPASGVYEEWAWLCENAVGGEEGLS